MESVTKGSIALYLIIGIVIVGGFFLTGGLFNYQYTNQNIPGAFVPLSPSPDNSQKSIQFHAFKFLYLTPTPTPNVSGNNGSYGNAIADYAASLANGIKFLCPPRDPNAQFSFVTPSTQGCIDPLKKSSGGQFADNVIDLLHLSTNLDGNLQCVGFVQAVALGIGSPLPNGNANMFGHTEPGYQWIPANGGTMTPGDITVWDSPWAGHIAVVVKVFPDNSFTVAEANGANGSVGFDTYPPGSAYGLTLLGWLRKL